MGGPTPNSFLNGVGCGVSNGVNVQGSQRFRPIGRTISTLVNSRWPVSLTCQGTIFLSGTELDDVGGQDGPLEAEKALPLWGLGVAQCGSLTGLSYPSPTSGTSQAQQQTLTVYTANFNNCVYPKSGKGRSLASAIGLRLVTACATPCKLFKSGMMVPEDLLRDS